MSRGVHIFYKLIEEKEGYLRYAYSGGDFSDKEELVRAYDGIVVIKKQSLDIGIDKCKYGIDYYQERSCAATKESHNLQVDNGDGTSVDRFALKVIFKVFLTYEKTSTIKENDAIVY